MLPVIIKPMVTVNPVDSHPGGDPVKILDQRQAQHDGDDNSPKVRMVIKAKNPHVVGGWGAPRPAVSFIARRSRRCGQACPGAAA